jgi:hypothetical protein
MDPDPNKRHAVITGARSAQEVEAYLPGNYGIVGHESDPHSGLEFLIEGEDVAGWTLDGYVIPRFASGLMTCRELFVWLEDDGDGESGPHLTSWLEDEPQTAEAIARRDAQERGDY